MRIGVNTRFLLPGKMEGFGWYTFEVTKRLVEQHPEHDFVFFFDRAFDQRFVFGENVSPIVLSPPARHPILFIFWFDFLLPRALKKHKIDVLFSPDGYVSLRTAVPQIATIHDINFEHFPKDVPQPARAYLRYFFPKFARKAKHILTVSNYSKKDICSTYSIDEDKITVAWNGASELFKPLNKEQILLVRKKFSDGKPYFVFVGSIHPRKNLNRLIEAFEKYIEDSVHTWNLIIVGTAMWDKNSEKSQYYSESISNRIKFTGHLSHEELANVVGAAGALAFVPYFEGFGIPLVEAMKCGVPILSGNLTSLPEVAGEAAIYCDPFDVTEITEGLIRISQDKNLQLQLSEKGLERSLLFNWNTTAETVWKCLEKAMSK